MKTSYKLLLGIALSIGVIVGAGLSMWPKGLKRCSIEDPNFDSCLLKATEHGISKIAKGLPGIGLSSLDPLRSVSFKLHSPRGPVSVALETTNVSIMGPSKMRINEVIFNRKTSHLQIDGLHEVLKLVGNYRVKGSILFFPINSAGAFEFELKGAHANHTLKLGKNVRDATHGHINFRLGSLKSLKIALKDSHIGAQASKSLSKLVNDNWMIITQTLTPSMEKAIHDMYTTALKPLTTKFTMTDFFPPATKSS